MTDRYRIEHRNDPLESLALYDDVARASAVLAPARGALLTRFSVDGDELLYLDEATLRDPMKNVRGGIPVLFPIAGRLRADTLVTGDGRRSTMKQHGFARTRPWSVSDATADATGARVTLELRSGERTRAEFPFDFLCSFTFELRDGTLTLWQRFANTGKAPMPIQPGLHPYFRVADADKRAARVPTNATTAYDNRTGTRVALDGPIDLTPSEVDLHLLDHTPGSARLIRPGAATVRLSYGQDQKVLVVWTLAGKDFVCVEPWTALANALNEGGGILVPPGGSHETFLTIGVEP